MLQTVDGEAALDEFEGLFRGARFHKGFEMVFTNTKAGGLALRIDGKDVSALCCLCMQNADLAQGCQWSL